MDHTDTPQTENKTSTEPESVDLARLAELADQAAGNPQVAAPLRELMPMLAQVVRQHAEVLTLLGA